VRKILEILGVAVVLFVAACGSDAKEPTREDTVKRVCDAQRAAECSTPAAEDCEEGLLTEWTDSAEHGCTEDFKTLLECVSSVKYDCAESLGTYRAECISQQSAYEDCSGHGGTRD
jgi:hypothetical protein